MSKYQTIADLLPNVDTYHQGLAADARLYLNNRGISDEVINRHKMGVCKYNNKLWIVIPIYGVDGKVAQVVLRKHPAVPDSKNQKRYILPKDSKAALFGAHALAADPDLILCCEGLLDACAAESLGFCAISSTAGVKTFPSDWFDFIPKTSKRRKFIVCFDRDDAGRDGAMDLLCRLAEARPDLELMNIELPEMGSGKDLTDFLQQCEAQDKYQALIALARPFTPPSPRDRLLDALSAETSTVSIAPCQGICGAWGYYTVTLRHEGEHKSYVITSERECFPCGPEEWVAHGRQLDREPVTDGISRWDQKQLIHFLLREDGEVFALSDLIHLVKEKIMQYVDFTDPRCFSVVATWIVMTYFYRLFPAIPYLHFTGLKGAGKTKIMQIISLLAFNGELVTSSSSPASITRLVHNNGATLGVDEAESLWNTKDENSNALQDILRSGYKTGILVTKCDKSADGKQIVVRFDPFSPKAVSGIKGLEDALSSRCIEVLMLRTTNREVANAEITPSSSEWQDLRAILYPAALVAIPDVHKAVAGFTVEQLTGRQAELWKPLLLIAQLAGAQRVYDELFSYALEQAAKRKDSEGDAEIGKLVQSIYELMGAHEKTFVSAEDIFNELMKEDEFGWMNDAKHKSRRGHWLNSRLKRLGVWDGPADVRSIHGEKKRGYEFERGKIHKAADRLGIILPSDGSPPADDSGTEPNPSGVTN